jgi:hypothetical protein
VENPYILNNAVQGAQFVGREDILQRLEELWGSDATRQVPSVVLYGHRRMGKTSILHNLGARFGAQTLLVDFNMQRFGRVASNNQLLYGLAVMIQRACERNGIAGLAPPDKPSFFERDSDLAFNLFLDDLDRVRAGHRFIITVDEFEKIEERIASGDLTPDLLELWRATFITFPWFIMAFAGLYTLREMTHNYWHPLFNSVEAIRVSFLTPGDARHLITNPEPDFPLDYSDDAIDFIIEQTSGQPNLVQHICHALVSRYNRQRFAEGHAPPSRFTRDDVAAVINAPDFDQGAAAYFSGVWQQAERSAPPGQPALLRALAPHTAGLSLEELAQAAGMPLEATRAALETLQAHDVVTESHGRFRYTVKLMRRWVSRQQVAG